MRFSGSDVFLRSRKQVKGLCIEQQASGGQAATSTIEKGEHDPEGVTVTSSLMEDTLTILKYFDRARAKVQATLRCLFHSCV